MQTTINNRSMLRVGTVLRGIYRIDSYLSSGGFGNTYVATNIEFDERVAIKEFFMKGISQRDDNQTTVSVSNRDNAQQFEEQREKFKKEARRLRRLHNNHLVRVHDLFEENGTAYYVMDYVDGENLSERLKRTGKPLAEDEVWQVALQVLDALRTIHEQGIWHLDLKPGNIMADRHGTVKLIDFGASKQMSSKQGGATTSTAVSFTNGFAPREQMEQNLDKFGPWTDLYALGATLYNLLSGKHPPLPTDIDDDISADKHLALPFPSRISQKMRNLVLWLMQTNRMQRPQSVDKVLSLMQNTVEEPATVIKPKPAPQPQPAPEPAVRPKANPNPNLKWMAIGGGALALLLVVIFSARGCGSAQKYDAGDAAAMEQVVDTIFVKSEMGNYRYVGDLDGQGNPDGQGEAWFEDGSYYKGPFSAGMFNGKDAYYKRADGDTFEGEFRSNNYYYGRYTIASDGSYFKGYYQDDQPSDGKWYDRNGKELE